MILSRCANILALADALERGLRGAGFPYKAMADLLRAIEPGSIPEGAPIRAAAPVLSRVLGREVYAGEKPNDGTGEAMPALARELIAKARKDYDLPSITRHALHDIAWAVYNDDASPEAMAFIVALYNLTPRGKEDPDWLPERMTASTYDGLQGRAGATLP